VLLPGECNLSSAGECEWSEWNVNTYRPTRRELDVVAAIIEFGTIDRAAAALGIAPSTVDRHIDNIRKKTGIHYLPQITAHATKLGWLGEN
jgi:DNA-binding NarL/FixJ family response regulator